MGDELVADGVKTAAGSGLSVVPAAQSAPPTSPRRATKTRPPITHHVIGRGPPLPDEGLIGVREGGRPPGGTPPVAGGTAPAAGMTSVGSTTAGCSLVGGSTGASAARGVTGGRP